MITESEENATHNNPQPLEVTVRVVEGLDPKNDGASTSASKTDSPNASATTTGEPKKVRPGKTKVGHRKIEPQTGDNNRPVGDDQAHKIQRGYVPPTDGGPLTTVTTAPVSGKDETGTKEASGFGLSTVTKAAETFKQGALAVVNTAGDVARDTFASVVDGARDLTGTIQKKITPESDKNAKEVCWAPHLNRPGEGDSSPPRVTRDGSTNSPPAALTGATYNSPPLRAVHATNLPSTSEGSAGSPENRTSDNAEEASSFERRSPVPLNALPLGSVVEPISLNPQYTESTGNTDGAIPSTASQQPLNDTDTPSATDGLRAVPSPIAMGLVKPGIDWSKVAIGAALLLLAAGLVAGGVYLAPIILPILGLGAAGYAVLAAAGVVAATPLITASAVMFKQSLPTTAEPAALPTAPTPTA